MTYNVGAHMTRIISLTQFDLSTARPPVLIFIIYESLA